MQQSNRAILYWLVILCVTIFTMIVVGGITRLTESGLSMVEWRPLLGTLPPLNDAEWQRVFTEYKQYPQYQLVNHGMSLDEFKYIFYWEYGHRVLGRLIGVMFALPFFYFLLAGKIAPDLKPKLWIALALGGMQGLMGWFMVKSGLVDEPLVSHFRLAAHLGLALIIFAYLSWLVMAQMQVTRLAISSSFNRWLWVLATLLVLQILYGAFVAGSRAGYGFNTYPLMNGVWLPDLALSHVPYWYNFFENKAMLQFIHRWLGAALLVVTVLVAILAFIREQPAVKVMATILLAAILGQFLLGILTLIYVVPVSLGSIHQAGACIVVLAVVAMFYRTRATS